MAFKNILKKKTDDLTIIDEFQDSLAQQVAWNKIKKISGAAFKTHFAIIENSSLLRFKRTVFKKLLPWLIILFSLVMAFIFNDFNIDLTSFSLNNSDQYIKVGIVLFLFLTGVVSMLFGGRHILFDRQSGFYYKGLKSSSNNLLKEGRTCTRLEKIHAIQIISKIVRSKNSRYRSYELNLILKNGERINVIDHANQESIRKDASLVSRFLNVPIWDVTI